MTRENGPAQPSPYPARKARGGVILLRTPLQRFVFIAGLAAAPILLVIVWIVLRG